MDQSYVKQCAFGNHLIRMAKTRTGSWQQFELDGSGIHVCESAPPRPWSLTQLGHPLTCPIECWWCGCDVFFHTNGHGDCVLLDALGKPWPVHACWEQNRGERDRYVGIVERRLQRAGYDGRAEDFDFRYASRGARAASKPAQRSTGNALRIKLHGPEPALLERAVADLTRCIRDTGGTIVGPIPLSATGTGRPRCYRRLVEVVTLGPDTLARFEQLAFPGGVDVSLQA